MRMSVIALLHESIPHIFAVTITHVLATTWPSFQIHNTHQLRADFQQTTSAADSCGVNILSNYRSQRKAGMVLYHHGTSSGVARLFEQIAVLSINVVFLISSIFFTYRLVKIRLSASSAWE